MHKIRRDVDHKLRVLTASMLRRLAMSARHVGISVSVGSASIAGGRPIDSTAWQASRIARQRRRNPPIARPPKIVKKILHLRTTYRLGPIRIVWYQARYHAAIIPFRGEDQVVKMANDSEFGLACAIWAENAGRAHRMIIILSTILPAINRNPCPFVTYLLSGDR